MSTCGQVLEKCSYNCLAYIQRKNMDEHLKVCSKRGLQKGQRVVSDRELAAERLASVEENLMFLRKALNEEIQMRHDVIGELGSLKRRNQVKFCHVVSDEMLMVIYVRQITDEWTIKVSEVLNLLQKRIEEEKQSRQVDFKDMNGVVENLLKEFKVC